jgi:hypothetical protein
MSTCIVAVDDSSNPVFSVRIPEGTSVYNTIQSTSAVTGSLVSSGGLGIIKNVYLGGQFIKTPSASVGNFYSISSTIGTLASTSNLNALQSTIGTVLSSNVTFGLLSISSIQNTTTTNLVSNSSSIGTLLVYNDVALSNSTVSTLLSTSVTIGSITTGNTLYAPIVSFTSGNGQSVISMFNVSDILNVGGETTIPNINCTSSSIGTLLVNVVSSDNLLVSNISTGNTSTGSVYVSGTCTIGLLNTNTVNLGNVFGTLVYGSNCTLNNLSILNSTISTLAPVPECTLGTLRVTGNVISQNSTIINLSVARITTGTLSLNSITTGTLRMLSLLDGTNGIITNLRCANATINNSFLAGVPRTLLIQDGSTMSFDNLELQLVQLGLRKNNGVTALRFSTGTNETLINNTTGTFINTIGSSVKFGYSTGTVGSTIDIYSPTLGDTTGNTGTVILNGSLILASTVYYTPNPSDIFKEITFSTANNQMSFADITNLRFLESNVRSFTCIISVFINATTSLYAQYKLIGVQKGTGIWVVGGSYIGNETGIEFGIVSSGGYGQIQYTSSNEAGFIDGKMAFTASTTTF